MLELIPYKHEQESKLNEKINAHFINESYRERLLTFYKQYEEKKRFECINTTAFEVNHRQFKKVYQMILDVSAKLKITPPKAYVYQSEAYCIKVQGISEPWLEMSGRLIEEYTDEELVFVIARKLTHLKEKYYETEVLCQQFFKALEINKKYDVQTIEADDEALVLQVAKWRRLCAYTEDKCGYLLCGNIEAAVQAIKKEMVQSEKLAKEIKLASFLNKERQILQSLEDEMPHVTVRIKELIYYASSEETKNYIEQKEVSGQMS